MKRALVLVCIATTAHADTSPGREERVAYITSVLDALDASDPSMLANTASYIQVTERNKCQAPVESLRVGCLLEAASRNCHNQKERDHCNRASDVIVTNRLSEKLFLPTDVRFKIMEKASDYRVALQRELRRRYALLVAELVMTPHWPGSKATSTQLATGIEAFCRDVAGSRDMSWQYCVGAVVWFIGTDGKDLTKAVKK